MGDWLYENDVVEAVAEQTIREAANDTLLPEGKARGLSLEELKSKTTCAKCGATGHWKDECPRRSNVTDRPGP